MTSKKLKPTAGPWAVDYKYFKRIMGQSGVVAECKRQTMHTSVQDNALLIAEAGSVFHECGLSPRELLDKNQDYKAQNARLTVALRNLCKHFPTDADMAELGWEVEYVETACQAYDTARAVLATQKE